MLWTDPRSWSLWVWCLHVLAALYVAGFLWFFFILRHEEKMARAGDRLAVERYNLRLRGFPNAFFSKMLGKRALVEGTEPKTGGKGGPEGPGDPHQ